MSKLSKIFSDVPVDIPNRSGKDMSHENLGTLPIGTLVPILCEQVNPNETFNLGYLMRVECPPFVTNFFGRIDLRLEAFFVPNRILWAGWKNFWTQPVNSPYDNLPPRPLCLPGISFDGDEYSKFLATGAVGLGSLSDYLGARISDGDGLAPFSVPNLLPYLAYHKIYDDWYRNSMIQKPVFSDTVSDDSSWLQSAPFRANPWSSGLPNADFRPVYTYNESGGSPLRYFNMGDGVSVFSLRQRNYSKDYFTTAALYPDSANGSNLKFSVNTETSEGQFSIASLRAANTLQRWLDRNNIAGFRYSDQIRAQYGILPSDAIMDRALFLGSDKFGIYNNSVTQQSPSDIADDRNPFRGNLGSKAGQGSGMNDGNLISNFTATEHGYIIVLASVVPHAYYGTGTRRHLRFTTPSDFPIPLLQGLGEQAIYKYELQDGPADWLQDTFGYTPQYSWAKFHGDEVHGQLRDGGSLQNFALKRSFAYMEPLTLGSEFIQIKQTALDEVLAAPQDGNFFWYDCFLNMKKVDTLSDYVIPTLGDLKNTHKEKIPFRGRQL